MTRKRVKVYQDPEWATLARNIELALEFGFRPNATHGDTLLGAQLYYEAVKNFGFPLKREEP